MHLTLLVPGVLVPRDLAAALAAPLAGTALATLVQRAELVGDSESTEPPHLAWLAEQLFQRPLPLATAPYAHAELTGQPLASSVVWHADPVHLELARDHLVLTPLPAPPDANEAAALLEAANALAATADLQFLRANDRWFATSARAWALSASPLSAVLGAPLQDAMPEGADARAWSRLLTEIQMTWHTHPVNASREERGQATINSLWLHGGGIWAPLPRPPYSAVLADAPEWRGAARAASVAAGGPDEAPRDGGLIVLDAALAAHALQDWIGWIAALRALDVPLSRLARDHTLDLVFTGGRTVRRLRARPGDRMRFWRTRPVEEILSA